MSCLLATFWKAVTSWKMFIAWLQLFGREFFKISCFIFKNCFELYWYQTVRAIADTHCIIIIFFLLSYFGHVGLYMIPWTVALQAPLSVEFSRWEYWSGLPFPSPEDLPNSAIEPESPALQADSLPVELHGKSFLEAISEMQIKIMSFFQKCDWQTSPVVQWLRICLPMQRTCVWSLLWEDSTCQGAISPGTTTTEVCKPRAHAPQ